MQTFSLMKPHTFWTPHIVFLRVVFLSFHGRSIDKALRSQWNASMNIFLPHDLDLWPMTFVDLWTWLNFPPLDLHAQIKVCIFWLWLTVMRVVTHTDTQCQNYYTHHVRDVGRYDSLCRKSCKKGEQRNWNPDASWNKSYMLFYLLHIYNNFPLYTYCNLFL